MASAVSSDCDSRPFSFTPRARYLGDSARFAAKVAFISGMALLLTLYGGIAFRIFVLKKPAPDPECYKKDTRTTALGVVLVLGFLIGLGTLGIYLAFPR
jgi:hypothetical protein